MFEEKNFKRLRIYTASVTSEDLRLPQWIHRTFEAWDYPQAFFQNNRKNYTVYSSFYYVQKVELRHSFVIIPIFIILESLQHSNYKKSRTNKHEKTIINIICMDNFYGQYLFTTNEQLYKILRHFQT